MEKKYRDFFLQIQNSTIHRFEHNHDPYTSTANSNKLFKKKSLKGTSFIFTQITSIKRPFSSISDVISLYPYWDFYP